MRAKFELKNRSAARTMKFPVKNVSRESIDTHLSYPTSLTFRRMASLLAHFTIKADHFKFVDPSLFLSLMLHFLNLPLLPCSTSTFYFLFAVPRALQSTHRRESKRAEGKYKTTKNLIISIHKTYKYTSINILFRISLCLRPAAPHRPRCNVDGTCNRPEKYCLFDNVEL